MKIRGVLLLLLFQPLLVEGAGPMTPPDSQASSLDFSMRFARQKIPLEYANRIQDSTSRWLGVNLREKAGRRVTLEFFGGYAFLTQTNNPLTAGVELDGYHAGFALHALLAEGRRASLYGSVEYIYQQVEHDSETQTVEIEWVQPQAEIGVIVNLAGPWRSYGGGTYGKIDGEERASGSVSHTLSFERGARSGGFLGLDLNVETDGYIGIEARSGLVRSFEIYFKRRF